MENEKYTNAKLSREYFEVVAQGTSKVFYIQFKKDQKNIGETKENIHAYFEKHNNLNNLDIPGISKKTIRGIEKRIILEEILKKGLEFVKEEFQNLKISSDATKRTRW